MAAKRTYSFDDAISGKTYSFDWEGDGEPSEFDFQSVLDQSAFSYQEPLGPLGGGKPSPGPPPLNLDDVSAIRERAEAKGGADLFDAGYSVLTNPPRAYDDEKGPLMEEWNPLATGKPGYAERKLEELGPVATNEERNRIRMVGPIMDVSQGVMGWLDTAMQGLKAGTHLTTGKPHTYWIKEATKKAAKLAPQTWEAKAIAEKKWGPEVADAIEDELHNQFAELVADPGDWAKLELGPLNFILSPTFLDSAMQEYQQAEAQGKTLTPQKARGYIRSAVSALMGLGTMGLGSSGQGGKTVADEAAERFGIAVDEKGEIQLSPIAPPPSLEAEPAPMAAQESWAVDALISDSDRLRRKLGPPIQSLKKQAEEESAVLQKAMIGEGLDLQAEQESEALSRMVVAHRNRNSEQLRLNLPPEQILKPGPRQKMIPGMDVPVPDLEGQFAATQVPDDTSWLTRYSEIADRRASRALARMSQRATQPTLFANPLGEVGATVADMADYGASKLVSFAFDQAAWSQHMLEQFGDAIRPHLEELWERAQALFDRGRDDAASRQGTGFEETVEKLRAAREEAAAQGIEPAAKREPGQPAPPPPPIGIPPAIWEKMQAQAPGPGAPPSMAPARPVGIPDSIWQRMQARDQAPSVPLDTDLAGGRSIMGVTGLDIADPAVAAKLQRMLGVKVLDTDLVAQTPPPKPDLDLTAPEPPAPLDQDLAAPPMEQELELGPKRPSQAKLKPARPAPTRTRSQILLDSIDRGIQKWGMRALRNKAASLRARIAGKRQSSLIPEIEEEALARVEREIGRRDPRDERGNRILSGQEDWSPARRQIIHESATAFVDQLLDQVRSRREGRFQEGQDQGISRQDLIERGEGQGKGLGKKNLRPDLFDLESGRFRNQKQGTLFETIPGGPKQIAAALGTGKPLELAIHEAISRDPEVQAAIEQAEVGALNLPDLEDDSFDYSLEREPISLRRGAGKVDPLAQASPVARKALSSLKLPRNAPPPVPGYRSPHQSNVLNQLNTVMKKYGQGKAQRAITQLFFQRMADSVYQRTGHDVYQYIGIEGTAWWKRWFQKFSGEAVLQPARVTIRALRNANVSTMLHESLHAMMGFLPEEDIGVLKAWAGVPEGRKLMKTFHEEKIVNAFERYLGSGDAGGVAPTPEMAQAFDDLAQFMAETYTVYEYLQPVQPLSSEVHDFFGKLMTGKLGAYVPTDLKGDIGRRLVETSRVQQETPLRAPLFQANLGQAISNLGTWIGGKLHLPGTVVLGPPLPPEVLAFQQVLRNAGKARKRTNRLYHEERQKRARELQEAAEKAPGVASMLDRYKILSKELPKADFEIDFDSANKLDLQTITAMTEEIDRSRQLRAYDKVKAIGALMELLLEKRVLQDNEVRTLDKVFPGSWEAWRDGKANAQGRASHSLEVAANFALDALSAAPRALMTSLDLSFFLAQAFLTTGRHPIRSTKQLGQAARIFGQSFFGNDRLFDEGMEEINQRPNASLYDKFGLRISEASHDLNTGEEFFVSRLADKLPWVRASSRSMVYFLNRARVDSFDQWVKHVEAPSRLADFAIQNGVSPGLLNKLGINTESLNPDDHPDQFSAAAKLFNQLTGAGPLAVNIGAKHFSLENNAELLSFLFFSPRYQASTIQLMSLPFRPEFYKMPPQVRAAYMSHAASGVALGLTVLSMLQMSDDEDEDQGVESDPRSVNFGGYVDKDGNRWDLFANYSTYARLISLMYAGAKKSASGRIREFGSSDPYSTTAKDVLVDFGRWKMSPFAGMVWDLLAGKDPGGQPVELTNEYGPTFPGTEIPREGELPGNLTPLALTNLLDLYEQNGWNRVDAAASIYSMLGGKLRVHKDRGPRAPELPGPPPDPEFHWFPKLEEALSDFQSTDQ